MEKGRINKSGTALEFRLAEKLQESRHFIEQVANSTPDIIYVLDLEKSRIIYTNRRMYDLLGNADNLFDIHPDDIEKRRQQLETSRSRRDEETSEIEIRLRAADNSWHWFRVREAVFRRKSGGIPKQLIGIAQDIHNEKLQEEDLRESKFFNDKIVDAIPGMLFVIDINNKKILFVSDHVRDVLGVEPGYVYEKGAAFYPEYCHPDDLERRLAHLEECHALVGDECKMVEVRLRIAGGGYKWFRIRDKVFKRGQNGDVIEIIGIVTDIEKEKFPGDGR